MLPKLNSAHGSDTRNIINRAIEVLNHLGIRVQELVANGQLTPSQFAELIKVVNGLINKGEVSVHDINKSLGKFDSTFFTSEFLEQINNAKLDVTNVLNGSLTSDKFADKSVIPEKTSFFDVSENKFNKDSIQTDTSLDSEGNIINESGFWLSEFISLPDSRIMSITSGSYRIFMYDSNKQFLLNSGITSSTSIDLSGFFNAKFIKLSGFSDPKKVMLNDGTTLLSFTEYKTVLKPEYSPKVDFKEIENVEVHPSQEIHFKKSANIYNRFKLQKDKTLGPYGKIINETGRYLSDEIILDPTKPLSTKLEDGYRFGIYDRNGNMINRMNKVVGVELTIDIPNIPNAYSMLVSPVELVKDQIMINEGGTPLPYEDYGFTLVSTPEIPIRIDDAIVPEGSGGGGGSDAPTSSIAGTSQIFESVNGVYSPNTLTDVYSTANTAQVDYIELSSNTLMAEIIVTYTDDAGVEHPYQIINTADFTGAPQTIGNIVEYGGVNVEFLQYDEGTSQYKIAIKSLNFSDGFKVQIRNTDTVDKSIAVQMAGRYYV